jgi:hypothetical protein
MTLAQAILVFLAVVVMVIFVLVYKGRYKPPKYPQFGR